jgi:probable rRNA maturation factor
MPRRSPAPEQESPLTGLPNVVRVSTQGGPFGGVNARVMKRRAEKMLAARGLSHHELSVALVDDATIRELNRSYRNQNKATDVLAFAMSEGEQLPGLDGEPLLLGDVIISVPTAGRQADRRNRPLLDELTMLLAHGLLHLLGYDHDTAKTEREMTAATEMLEQAAARRARR